jgi:hypothetical protein
VAADPEAREIGYRKIRGEESFDFAKREVPIQEGTDQTIGSQGACGPLIWHRGFRDRENGGEPHRGFPIREIPKHLLSWHLVFPSS